MFNLFEKPPSDFMLATREIVAHMTAHMELSKKIEKEIQYMNDRPVMERLPGALSPDEESTKLRLERIKTHLTGRIADIDEALALLDKYPDIEKLTDLLRRI